MSDILIKGMEMPTSCDECRIMVFEDTNCVPELFCGCPIVFKAHPQGVGHRPDYCPLNEVPNHGRLIDADDLIRRCNQHINECENSIAPQAQYYRDRDRDFIRSLEIAPTIIPAEEET